MQKRNGVYYLRDQTDGQDTRISTGCRNIRDAKRWAKNYNRKPIPTTKPGLKLGEVNQIYLAQSGIKLETKQRNITVLYMILKESGTINPETAPVLALTRTMLEKWKQYRSSKGYSPRGTNSFMRQAKSIFSQDMTVLYGTLPEQLQEFLKTPYFKTNARDRFYPPSAALIQTMKEESTDLLEDDRLTFLLGICAGLRKSEIAAARWDWVQEDCIQVMNSNGFSTKSGEDRSIPLDRSLKRALQQASRAGDYILTEPIHGVYLRLKKWLRSLGWTEKPLHGLRVYFGSVVARDHGLFQAQSWLGHVPGELLLIGIFTCFLFGLKQHLGLVLTSTRRRLDHHDPNPLSWSGI